MRPKTAEDYLDYFLTATKEESVRPRNFWIEYDPTLTVYIRRAYRILGGRALGARLTTVLDIANVTAKVTGQGRFTKFLEHVETICPYEGVFIENVMDKRFMEFFRKRGYAELGTINTFEELKPTVASFYKLWNRNN